MDRKTLLALGLVGALACLLLLPDPAFAGPGGEIVSALFRTVPGKFLMAFLTILFLPVIVYVVVKEHIAEQRTLQDLRRLARVNDQFDWFRVKERVTEVFHRVHAAWRREDMEEASAWMTDWYWRNQQMAYLDQWERDGLVNHCRVKAITRVRPLFVRYVNKEGTLDGSRLVVSIIASMEDYLAERRSGKIVQGAKGYTDAETVWTFVFEHGHWLLANIERGALSLVYAKMTNEMPQPPAMPNKIRIG